jgi:ATP phosphoribosyltransferase
MAAIKVSSTNAQLTLGLPKGSLEAATMELFRKSGWKISGAERSYFPSVDDDTLRCVLTRPQEMSRYVEDGVLDAGITGKDWTLENNSDVHVVSDFIYSKTSMRPTRWVVVVPQASPITTIAELAGKRIATEMVGFTRRYFAERNIEVDVEFSWGATEAKVVQGLVDAIVEVTETGSTLRANGLRIIDELCQSNPQLIANRTAWADAWKHEKIEQIALLLNGALQAEAKVGLKMNVPKERLDAIIGMIPSITAPTVSPLYKTEWFAVETVIAEARVRELIPQLLKQGAVGIIEYPLNKVI